MMAAQRRGWRRIARWFVVTVVCLVVAVILTVTVANYRASSRVKSIRAELARQGVPTRIADLQNGDIPEAENAYRDLERWREELVKAESEVCGTEEKYEAYLTRAPLEAERARELETILTSHQQLLVGLESASVKKYFSIPLPQGGTQAVIEKSLNEVQLLRSLARLFIAEVNLKIAQGQRDEAIQSAITILNWSLLAEQQPLLTTHLVTLAIQGMGMDAAARVLYAGDVSNGKLDDLVTVLSRFDVNRRWKNSLYSELAYFSEVFQPSLPTTFRSMWFQLDAEAEYLEAMQTVAAGGVVNDDGKLSSLPNLRRGWMWDLLSPAVQAAHGSNGDAESRRRALLMLIQWRKSNSKAQSIADLKVVPEMSTDIYSGGEMKFVSSLQGPTIYSVGRNGIDDKGDFSRNNDVGFGPGVGMEE